MGLGHSCEKTLQDLCLFTVVKRRLKSNLIAVYNYWEYIYNADQLSLVMPDDVTNETRYEFWFMKFIITLAKKSRRLMGQWSIRSLSSVMPPGHPRLGCPHAILHFNQYIASLAPYKNKNLISWHKTFTWFQTLWVWYSWTVPLTGQRSVPDSLLHLILAISPVFSRWYYKVLHPSLMLLELLIFWLPSCCTVGLSDQKRIAANRQLPWAS